MQRYPMKLVPVCKDYLWGGRRLLEAYGKQADSAAVAESWELACHENGMCSVENGSFAGKTLWETISQARAAGVDIVGSRAEGQPGFPLLIKWIDAQDRLSVQVHPDDAYARQHGAGAFGKTEMWYVAEAKEGARLVYGMSRDVSREEFREAASCGRLDDMLNVVPVKRGDCLFIPAGLVHAILDGILIVEIQQNSDTTYRVYDWNRRDAEGKSRPLHVDHAVAAAKLKQEPAVDFSAHPRSAFPGGVVSILRECSYFRVYRYDIETAATLCAEDDSFHCLTILSGEGRVTLADETTAFDRGDSIYIPAGSGQYEIRGRCEVLVTML